MEGFEAIVFDLDGTLVDSVASIAAAVNTLLAEERRPALSLDAVESMVGEGALKLLERAFAATGETVTDEDALEALFHRYVPMLAAMPPKPADLYPGVIDTLHDFRVAGIALGVCTNKPMKPARAALRALGIDEMFGAVIGGDTLPQRKPSPEPLLAAIAGLDATPEVAVMIGDNIYDVGTARGAGVPVVAVSYGYPRMPIEDLGADLVIDRFDQLPNALTRLAERRNIKV